MVENVLRNTTTKVKVQAMCHILIKNWQYLKTYLSQCQKVAIFIEGCIQALKSKKQMFFCIMSLHYNHSRQQNGMINNIFSALMI